MSKESLRDILSSSTWWTTSSYDDKVLNGSEGLILIFSIVPTFVVHELSNKLKRRNGSPLFFLRHVDVINKEDELLTNWWTEDTFSSLVESAIKLILSLIGRGLGGEDHCQSLILLFKLEGQQLGNVYGFACTSRSWANDVLRVGDQKLGK